LLYKLNYRGTTARGVVIGQAQDLSCGSRDLNRTHGMRFCQLSWVDQRDGLASRGQAVW